MTRQVLTKEVMDLLRQIGSGKVIPKLKNSDHTWEYVYAGNVYYIVGGWEVVLFNDCNSWDYIDSIIAPDGRRWDFNDNFGDEVHEGGFVSRLHPDGLLHEEDPECFNRMAEAFAKAV